jgi:cytochrome c oxidase assembly factor CtaG
VTVTACAAGGSVVAPVSEKVISLDALASLDSAHAVTSAAAPTTSALLATWTVHPVVLAILIAVAGLYVWGMLRVRRRHPSRPWPVGRAASFAGGLVVIVVALMSAIGRYDTMLFWVHMIQHLLLIMVAPALLSMAGH